MSPTARRLAAVSALYWAAALAAPALADFAVDDDWTHKLTVAALADEGRLFLWDWQSANLLTLMGWGAAFRKLFGDGYGPLRLSTLVLGWLGALSFHETVRRDDDITAAPLTLALLTSPLFLVLSASFMSDVPTLALSLIALACWRAGFEDKDERRLWAGSIAAALAVGVRQTAVMLVAVPLWRLWREKRLRGPNPAAALVLPALTVLAFSLWRRLSGVPVPDGSRWVWEGPAGWMGLPPLRALAALHYIGLFGLPVSIALWADGPIPRPPARAKAWLLGAAGVFSAAAAFLLWAGPLPWGNEAVKHGERALFGICSYLNAGGLGCPGVEGWSERPLFWLGSGWPWTLLTILSLASLGTLAFSARQALSGAGAWLALGLGLQAAAAASRLVFYDRYLLPLLPAALAVGVGAVKTPRGRAALWAGTIAVGLFSWAVVADGQRAVSAAWALGRAAVASGASPVEVKASQSWCWAHETPALVERLRGELGTDELRRRYNKDFSGLPMSCLAAPRLVVSFRAPETLRVRREPLAETSFWSPASLRRETLYLYAR